MCKTGGLTPEAYTRGASLIRTMTPEEKEKLIRANLNLGRDSLYLHSIPPSETY